jgi:hypothetical protein|tara:strand:- start:7113 stop:7271 length:159 start_codon:yes stop_codon:yes gene_type:complete
MKAVTWIENRFSEPSSYVAIGLGAIGLGLVVDIPVLIYVGLAGSIVGFLVSE